MQPSGYGGARPVRARTRIAFSTLLLGMVAKLRSQLLEYVGVTDTARRGGEREVSSVASVVRAAASPLAAQRTFPNFIGVPAPAFDAARGGFAAV